MIGGLLDKGEVDLSALPDLNKTVITLDRKTRTTTVRVLPPDPQYEMLVDLVQLIRLKDFPFARCQQCPTIFVPVKNQKFCSAQCSRQAGAKPRRDYMRGYMRERRNSKSRRK